MRIKVGDPLAWFALITLDGKNVSLCVAADSDEGWADVLALDERGDVIIGNGNVKIERKRGGVVIAISVGSERFSLANEMDASEG